MNKPNFLVVGAAKSGTTSLDGFLKQHPEVFLPEVKECRYFSNVKDQNINPFTQEKHTKVISDFDEYYKLFQNKKTKAIGDISPDYLYYYDESIKNIKKELGIDIKIIIILRNPIQRAYSNYLHLRRDSLTNKSFEEIIELEQKFANDTWYGFKIIDSGFYFDAVKSYIDNFKNVKVILFEDFISNTKYHMKDICDFLNIDKDFIFQEPEFKNKTGIPKNKFIDNLTKGKIPFKNILKWFIFKLFDKDKVISFINNLKANNLEKPKLSDSVNEKLHNLYKDDMKKLEKLLKRDLSIWK